MVQAATIIHTRTRSCDFPSTLAVCPSVLSSSEVAQVHKQILAATRSIDTMRQDEVRYMVYTCGNHIVAGMVSFLKNLAENSAADEKFFADEKGRSIYAFVGFAFRKGHSITPRIDKKVLWDKFKSYMEPIWERTVLETQTSNLTEMGFPEADIREPAGAETVAEQTLYIMGANDTHLFSYWLGQALQGKAVSFCSNLTDARVVKEKAFRILTTKANTIERIKKEAAAPPQTRSMPADVSSRSSAGSYQKKNADRKGGGSHGQTFIGTSKNLWILIAGLIFILILLIVLLR